MLRCAYLPDGAPGPVVLVWGSAEDLRRLAALFLDMSVSPREVRIGDEDSPGKVTVRFDHRQRGMQVAGGVLS